MINDALASFLRSNISLSVYIGQAPLNSQPCIVIDDNGDSGDRYWRNGAIHTGLKDQEYEISVFTDLSGGGPKYAAQVASSLVALLDNFSGPMVDTAISPNAVHRVAYIEANNGGGGFDAGPELHSHSVFITLSYE